MAKYYAIISGLPNIGVEDRKLPFSSRSFLGDLEESLSTSDRKLFNLLLWEDDHKFFLDYLEDSEKVQEQEEKPKFFSYDELALVIDAIKQNTRMPKNTLPPYFIPFIQEFFIEREEEENEEEDKVWPTHLEDKLSAFYYEYVLRAGNSFIKEWSRLNLNIKNVFAAFTSRKLGWDPKEYIVGESDVEQKLRNSNASNFGIEEEDIEYFSTLVSIQAEADITKRERLLDVLKWNWLEEVVFDKVFEVETLLAYFLKIRIIERWTDLNEKKGEERFRAIVAELKQQSNRSLNEFKKNQKK